MDAFDAMRAKMSDIEFATFARRVEWQPIAVEMGYGRKNGLLLKNDWSVRFYKSTYKGIPVYIMVHSAIEYVFAKGQRLSFYRNPWS